MMVGSIVGTPSEEGALKSLKALKMHCSNSKDDVVELISITITMERPIVKRNDYIARVVSLPHKFGKVRSENNLMLMITKDPVLKYRNVLEKPDCDTENLFKEILGFKQFQRRMTNSKYAKRIHSEYSYIMADERIHHKLFDVLGDKFYRKSHKKIPLKIMMDLPEVLEKIKSESKLNKANASLRRDKYGMRADELDAQTKKRKSMGSEEDTEGINPAYIYQQVKSIVRNTVVTYTDRGTTLAVKIGTSNMKTGDLLENIEQVVQFLTDARFKEEGGGLLTIANVKKRQSSNMIRNIYVKTKDSASLPVYLFDNVKLEDLQNEVDAEEGNY